MPCVHFEFVCCCNITLTAKTRQAGGWRHRVAVTGGSVVTSWVGWITAACAGHQHKIIMQVPFANVALTGKTCQAGGWRHLLPVT